MTRFYGLIVFFVVLAACGHKSSESMPPSEEWNAVASPQPSRAPHGAIGTDVTKLGLSAPDPTRIVDPTHHVRGEITVKPELAAKVSQGGALFLIAKREANGAPTGPPLAVQKLIWRDGLAFELTERNAMITGTELTGDVIVIARFDQDGDALTKQPGDLSGQLRVTVPADAVALVLDTVQP